MRCQSPAGHHKKMAAQFLPLPSIAVPSTSCLTPGVLPRSKFKLTPSDYLGRFGCWLELWLARIGRGNLCSCARHPTKNSASQQEAAPSVRTRKRHHIPAPHIVPFEYHRTHQAFVYHGFPRKQPRQWQWPWSRRPNLHQQLLHRERGPTHRPVHLQRKGRPTLWLRPRQ